MRSCRGREWGHGVRSLGGSGGEAWRSEQREAEHGWESEQNWGEQRVRVQEGGPKSWLRREGGQRGAGELDRCEDQKEGQARGLPWI